MNSKSETRQIKLEHWAVMIHECVNSGIKVKEWCIHNHISKDTYYYWFKEVQEAAVLHNQKQLMTLAPAFVPIPAAVISAAPDSRSAPLIIHLGKVSIEVTAQTSSDYITHSSGSVCRCLIMQYHLKMFISFVVNPQDIFILIFLTELCVYRKFRPQV